MICWEDDFSNRGDGILTLDLTPYKKKSNKTNVIRMKCLCESGKYANICPCA